LLMGDGRVGGKKLKNMRTEHSSNVSGQKSVVIQMESAEARRENEQNRIQTREADLSGEENRSGAHGEETRTTTRTRTKGEELLDELEEVMKRFVVLPKFAAEALALFVVHTYAYELREISTYVGVESPEKRCGKTTLLGLLSKLVCRPVVAANISPPAFFQVIEEMKPTLLVDEADTFLQGNDELRGILNAGYRTDTAYVLRIGEGRNFKDEALSLRGTPGAKLESSGRGSGEGQSCSRVVKYSCWCPKVLCAIGPFPETLADRCIVILMERKRNDEVCERLRNLDGRGLGERCARFVEENSAAIASARPEPPATLNDREAEIWEPLLAIADIAGGDWPEKARAAAAGLSSHGQESRPIGSLVLDLGIAFVSEKVEKMLTRDLLPYLDASGSRPWTALLKGRREVTEIWLAQQLRPYGVRPRTLRIGEMLGKGYLAAEVIGAGKRYVTRADLEEVRR
jgi:hypothetical protein